jgi:hypothetical protein
LFSITKRIGALAAIVGAAFSVIPTDEERMIAEIVCCVLGLDGKKEN